MLFVRFHMQSMRQTINKTLGSALPTLTQYNNQKTLTNSVKVIILDVKESLIYFNNNTRRKKLMSINMELMKKKLATLRGELDGREQSAWFRPDEGDQDIRIVPAPDGDPR